MRADSILSGGGEREGTFKRITFVKSVNIVCLDNLCIKIYFIFLNVFFYIELVIMIMARDCRLKLFLVFKKC